MIGVLWHIITKQANLCHSARGVRALAVEDSQQGTTYGYMRYNEYKHVTSENEKQCMHSPNVTDQNLGKANSGSLCEMHK